MAFGGPGTPPCEATYALTLAAHSASSDCDAGPGIVGYVGVGQCGDLESVRWVYGFPGDTHECIYARDGGAWVGGISYTDRGPIVAGQVGDCSEQRFCASP